MDPESEGGKIFSKEVLRLHRIIRNKNVASAPIHFEKQDDFFVVARRESKISVSDFPLNGERGGDDVSFTCLYSTVPYERGKILGVNEKSLGKSKLIDTRRVASRRKVRLVSASERKWRVLSCDSIRSVRLMHRDPFLRLLTNPDTSVLPSDLNCTIH